MEDKLTDPSTPERKSTVDDLLNRLAFGVLVGVHDGAVAHLLDARVENRVDLVARELGLGVVADLLRVRVKDVVARLDDVHRDLVAQDLGHLLCGRAKVGG